MAAVSLLHLTGYFIANGTSETVCSTGVTSSNSGLVIVAQTPTGITATKPTIVTKSITTLPIGQYRVLAWVEKPDGANMKGAMGSAYSGVTPDPSIAADYPHIAATQTAFQILYISSHIIPEA